MKILEHPYFSLLCFFLNVWFGLANAYDGNTLFAIICALCAGICFKSYLNTRGQ